MLYSEDKKMGNKYREGYLDSINKIIEKREEQAKESRNKITDEIAKNPEKHREGLKKMLGWPLVGGESRRFKATEEFVAEDELSLIYRVTLELEIGLKAYGILMVPKGVAKPKAVLCQHGGAGCPELLIGLYRQTNYNDMPRRLLRRGVAVYSPQLLLWNSQDLECSENNRDKIDARLRQLGGSVTALEIFALMTAIDYLHEGNRFDCDEFTMVGLSYGGFYTIFTSAIDTRIKRAYSSCFFNDRIKYTQQDWAWFNSAYTYLDGQVAAMIAPRKLYIDVADEDEVFAPDNTKAIAETVQEVYNKLGYRDEFVFNIFHGHHEFPTTDEGIDFVLP